MKHAKFAMLLREVRKKHNLTQEELADEIGVSAWSITSYETGRRLPRPLTMRKIIDRFELKQDYFSMFQDQSSQRPSNGVDKLHKIIDNQIQLIYNLNQQIEMLEEKLTITENPKSDPDGKTGNFPNSFQIEGNEDLPSVTKNKEDHNETKPVLTPTEVANLLSVSISTVIRWIKLGKLKASKLGNSTYRVYIRDVKQMMKDQEVKSI